MTARIWNVSHRKVGGIRFLKLGRINISLSVAKRPEDIEVTARAMAERTASGFRSVVFLLKDGKLFSRHDGLDGFADAGLALAHAQHAAITAGIPFARRAR